ncbi:Similar to Serine/threonine-protein kinase chk1; acc. no. P34208 [Pyronema omphalodes CBS 100304]|uniref:Similar to Serine/threonine-protein kinase chk1 acc. no. P34208 n=1 Tax=Pyronema omphalodes (strain CBS 100304) TaxID=1076935 RepID=U4L3H5_PYROM|nr:Similar to Serine/threonine-protein kinase chk1; acc. no. P34208 [Pyronema omphalodes CBS 100304]
MTTLTQLDPLPTDLPFDVVSKTIGRGAYASVKKGKSDTGVFAVKFVHKKNALERGHISVRQLRFEVELHKLSSGHKNLIQFYGNGENDVWIWIAMEYAQGGDLFDKIEPDVGLPEDIAHFYFVQMISGLSWMHGKGIAHRDLKPENILLDENGNLKIADFGLAVLFHYKGKYKESSSLCGSPPYAAPEVLVGSYRADYCDIWSCGVVLFTLLVGNTPWDEPTDRSFEFDLYKRTKGRPSYEPWPFVPNDTLSLLRGMMSISTSSRFSLERIRDHPWFTRHNPYLSLDGRCSDGVGLAAKMMENLKIDFDKQPPARHVKVDNDYGRLSSTQPVVAAVGDMQFDIERMRQPFASQPTARDKDELDNRESQSIWANLAEDPTMSQFAPRGSDGLVSLTQHASKFEDICPFQRLTRFFSSYSFRQILPILSSSLHRMGIVIPPFKQSDYDDNNMETWIHIKTEDRRKCPLRGDIIVERLAQDMLQVTFSKNVGDPLEWRRFFKEVTVLSKEAVYTGDN